MGYRSNVFFAIAGKKDDLEAFLTAAQLLVEFQPVFEEYESKRGKYGEQDVFVIQGNWKHYDSYPEVRALDAFWDHANEDEEHLDGVYIIVGEEPDDITQKYFGSGYDLAGVSTNINVEVTFEETATAP